MEFYVQNNLHTIHRLKLWQNNTGASNINAPSQHGITISVYVYIYIIAKMSTLYTQQMQKISECLPRSYFYDP